MGGYQISNRAAIFRRNDTKMCKRGSGFNDTREYCPEWYKYYIKSSEVNIFMAILWQNKFRIHGIDMGPADSESIHTDSRVHLLKLHYP